MIFFLLDIFRRIIGNLEIDPNDSKTLLLAPHFLNLVNRTIAHVRSNSSCDSVCFSLHYLGQQITVNWTSIDLLQIIGNEKMTNIRVLTETIKLLDAIVIKQKRQHSLVKFNELEICEHPHVFKTWDQSHSSNYSIKNLISSCFIVVMEMIRFCQQTISILKAPKTALLICELIKRCYHMFISQGKRLFIKM
ncbi:hypothetical protein RFI_30347 [Reticulomyxa filosa]|uniref:Uncharacterized protein n=1 Tax=Reticulomyxa filosa TaxID=46433 RepID=X6M233_RETFI|nr:hypothetical protein RFI_30347 [Reticulomyxa filosa]|eukprot:ETO07045.1 hypothetical protein RFI_30347 [Reticulomyxa filosa]